MPIYEYRCASCGFQKEYLQKVSDPPLAECPACGAAQFKKLVTAAGFQLKGTGWYVTDFKNGSQPAAKKTDDPAKGDDGKAAKSEPATGEAASDSGSKTATTSPDSSSPNAASDSASAGSGANEASK